MSIGNTYSPAQPQLRLQPALRVGAVDDAHEREADTVADQVVQRLPLSGVLPLGHREAPAGIQRKCAGCEDEDTMQRKPLVQAKSNAGAQAGIAAPAAVQQGIQSSRGGGQPMAPQPRAQMENAFGRPFGGVRIHTGAHAESLSQQVNARAFTIGQDIYFNRGEYQPDTRAGQRLLAHELTHTVQQAGHIQRQDQPETEMTRADFEKELKTKYGVQSVLTATKADTLAAYGMTTETKPDPFPAWAAWDPGAKSAIYKDVLDSFAAIDTSLGGVPKVNRVIFSESDYEKDAASGTWKKAPDTGGMWNGKDITVYSTINNRNKALPFARSDAKGEYGKGKPILVHSYEGDANAAPIGYASDRQTTMRIMIHELGHAIESAIAYQKVGPDNKPVDIGVITDFADAVGWHQFNRLYDIGVAEVKEAIQKKTAPPAGHQITIADWNDPKWVEQPMSEYAVKGGASEDFAESVMVYVENAALLKSRSPSRHAFIESRKAKWLPALQKTPVAAQQQPAQQQPAQQGQGAGPLVGPRPLSPVFFAQPNPAFSPGALALPSPSLIDWGAMRSAVEGRGAPYNGPMQDSIQSTWMQSYRFYNQVLQLPPAASATWTNRTMPMMIGSALSRDYPTPMEQTDRAFNTSSIIFPVSDIFKLLLPKK